MTSSAAALARIEGICVAATDARSLRLELLDELREVGFGSYAWLLTDPQTQVGWAPIIDLPDPGDLPRLIRLKYLATINRWTTLTPHPVASLVHASAGDPSRSLVWRELLRDYDVRDVASVAFGDASGCWAFLDLWRSGDQPAFTLDELARLDAAVEPITAALRRTQAAQFKPVIASGEQPAGPVVLLLSPQLRLLAQTPQSESYLQALVPTEDGREPILAAAFNVAAQLVAREQGVDDNPPWARVHLHHGQWLTLRAARIGDGSDPDRDRATDAIAVTIEATSTADRLDLFARTTQLSRPETELLQLLVTGVDTRQIATQMMLPELTVQDHYRSTLGKTSTRTRRQLVARATGI